jgi:hypothetical protein
MSRLARLLSVGLLLWPAEALACGGCFGPMNSSTPTVVTGHRMAFSILDDHLWLGVLGKLAYHSLTVNETGTNTADVTVLNPSLALTLAID